MKTRYYLLAFVLTLVLSPVIKAQDTDDYYSQSCTSIMVGKLASEDGSVITSHTCDGKYRSWTYMEPAADHKPGAMHAVYKGTMKTSFRGDSTGVTIAGYIPEAAHTYSYLNSAYPIMNEKQLAMGETTFGGPDTLRNPSSMFMIEELQRVALQRCTKAREAVILMGKLAEKYGYGDGGECLTVADKDEVWQFEIIGCGKNKTGAVWVAKRVPDDHVAVSANVPRIGKLEKKDKANFLCSDNVEKVAIECGLWDGKGEFLFWKVYNCTYGKGRNYRERDWYVLNTLAPSAGLTQNMASLPFSVKPDHKVSVRQVMEIFRSTYEGTDLDMCKKLSGSEANPWMTSTKRNLLNKMVPGIVEFSRTVSVGWCAYSHVTQLRNWLPDEVGGICWYSVDNPGQSPRVPIFSGVANVPVAYHKCGQFVYYADSALWTYRRANKLATVDWSATKKGFMEKVLEMEDYAFDALKTAETEYEAKGVAALEACTQNVFDHTAGEWKAMEESFWLRFGLGF